MKKPIFWTLVPGWPGYVVIAVTSLKHSQVYGRNDRGEATHRRRSDCRGQFETREAAQSVIAELSALSSAMSELRRPIESQLADIGATERRRTEEILSGAGAVWL